MAEFPGNPKFSRKLAAILAADIAGYTALVGNDEARTVRDLKAQQAVIVPMIAEHSGRIILNATDLGDQRLKNIEQQVRVYRKASAPPMYARAYSGSAMTYISGYIHALDCDDSEPRVLRTMIWPARQYSSTLFCLRHMPLSDGSPFSSGNTCCRSGRRPPHQERNCPHLS
jgi:hypothetical protein